MSDAEIIRAIHDRIEAERKCAERDIDEVSRLLRLNDAWDLINDISMLVNPHYPIADGMSVLDLVRARTAARAPSNMLTPSAVDAAMTTIAKPDFPWCRARFFTALAGAARTVDRDTGESVLREVLDEAGLDDADVRKLVDYMRATAWLRPDEGWMPRPARDRARARRNGGGR